MRGPVHSVTTDHVRQFVGHSDGGVLLVRGRRHSILDEQTSLAVGDQPPVLHGAGVEVRNGGHRCRNENNISGFPFFVSTSPWPD